MAVSLTLALSQGLDTAKFETGKCLVFVRNMLGVNPKYPTATRAFQRNQAPAYHPAACRSAPDEIGVPR
jgi:hypothetical protein